MKRKREIRVKWLNRTPFLLQILKWMIRLTRDSVKQPHQLKPSIERKYQTSHRQSPISFLIQTRVFLHLSTHRDIKPSIKLTMEDKRNIRLKMRNH